MAAPAYVAPVVITAFWVIVGAVLPFFVPKGPNKGWLCTYIAQLNPLFGPQVNNVTLSLMYNSTF
ncbi:unnamed protein product [Oppiella nova]|uniref:Uncharacterized protein n=1 Tax=Oppiella nova TaxID=334625 RepID=A0A7R9LPX5_9ACAR|nr:unnamed protein product [Oppiella nova]CAG2165812.1 unnamed protein product [Oppiella nova]